MPDLTSVRLVSGLGGAFLFSARPKELAGWYAAHLGFAFEGDGESTFYQVFFALDPERPDRKLDTHFGIMRANEDFARPAPAEEPDSMYGDQPFMLNVRTDDLDALIARLEAGGVAVLQRQDESYGRFAWVRDPDGNRVELYQPLAAP
ncbi:MAG TPA: VOC family protein [Rubricoccaceae bacterium]|nr:VOC family protein [Rubricoccaceae bacterium]